MINGDDTNELEQMPSVLPPLYSAWMARVLEGPPPQETKATCSNCVMCQSASAVTGSADTTYFNSETKCCTWLPELPNFLVGRILADDSLTMREGRVSVGERLQKRVAVTPLGLAQNAMYRLLYNQANGTLFGKSRALRCPHYIAEGGYCGIWKHREAVCATWFCKHERGAAGQRFWQATKQLLRAVEEGVSAWCVYQLDVGTQALGLLFPSVQQGNQGPLDSYLLDDGSVDPTYYKALWGKWAGREELFFRTCATLVDPLRWEEICTICGSKISIYARLVQEAYRALHAKTIPPVLRVRPYRTVKVEPTSSQVISYSPYDPLRVGKELRDVLPYFDGSPLDVVQQAIKTEKKMVLSEGLIRKLIDYDIVGPATETTR